MVIWRNPGFWWLSGSGSFYLVSSFTLSSVCWHSKEYITFKRDALATPYEKYTYSSVVAAKFVPPSKNLTVTHFQKKGKTFFVWNGFLFLR